MRFREGIILEEDVIEDIKKFDEADHEEIKLLAEQAEQMVEFIQDHSREGNLTCFRCFYEAPFKLDEERMTALAAYLDRQAVYPDIQIIHGSKEHYFYSTRWITLKYAEILVRVKEQNLFQLIAETVRQESKIYPRPTHVKLFTVPPYNFPKAQIEEVLQQLQKEPEYQDIELIKASNGVGYLFSSQYMKKAYALSLAQWQEVEQYENP